MAHWPSSGSHESFNTPSESYYCDTHEFDNTPPSPPSPWSGETDVYISDGSSEASTFVDLGLPSTLPNPDVLPSPPFPKHEFLYEDRFSEVMKGFQSSSEPNSQPNDGSGDLPMKTTDPSSQESNDSSADGLPLNTVDNSSQESAWTALSSEQSMNVDDGMWVAMAPPARGNRDDAMNVDMDVDNYVVALTRTPPSPRRRSERIVQQSYPRYGDNPTSTFSNRNAEPRNPGSSRDSSSTRGGAASTRTYCSSSSPASSSTGYPGKRVRSPKKRSERGNTASSSTMAFPDDHPTSETGSNSLGPDNEAVDLDVWKLQCESSGVWRCQIKEGPCSEQTFATWGDLKRHMTSTEPHSERSYFCDFCDESFLRPFHLRRHIGTKHPRKRNRKGKSEGHSIQG